ncbi:MAG: hypothetical protein Q7T55_12730 [Solirubrobacteraceae bacterium]|nr:hypothetical protein [Solirubrobacteraceae bacterium]
MNITKSAVAAIIAAAALSGCGDSDKDVAVAPGGTSAESATATTGGTTPAGTSPVQFEGRPKADLSKPVGKKEGTWAKQLCTALSGKASAIKPPQVDTTSPEATLTSLRTFFGDVVDEQESQLKTLESVGPPPGDQATSEWKKAVQKLRDVRGDVNDVVADLKDAKATNATQVQSIITDLGKQLKSLSDYGGPIPALFSNDTIGPALGKEPSCERFS